MTLHYSSRYTAHPAESDILPLPHHRMHRQPRPRPAPPDFAYNLPDTDFDLPSASPGRISPRHLSDFAHLDLSPAAKPYGALPPKHPTYSHPSSFANPNLNQKRRSSVRDRCVTAFSSVRTLVSRLARPDSLTMRPLSLSIPPEFLTQPNHTPSNSNSVTATATSTTAPHYPYHDQYTFSQSPPPPQHVRDTVDSIWSVVRASSVEFPHDTQPQSFPLYTRAPPDLANQIDHHPPLAHSADLSPPAAESEYVLRDMFGRHVRSNPRFDEKFSDANNLSKLNDQLQTHKVKASDEKAFTSTTATASSTSATTATTASSIQSTKAEKENQSKYPNTNCNVNINHASSRADTHGPLNGTRQDTNCEALEESAENDRGKKRERKGFRKLARKVVPRRLLGRQSGSDDDGMVDLDSMSPYDSNGYVVDFQQLYPYGPGSGGGHSEAKDQAAKRAAAAVAKMQLAAAQARAALITPARTDGTGKVQGQTAQEEREDKGGAEKSERDLARESFVTVVTVPLQSELGLELDDGDDGQGDDDGESDGIVSVETGPLAVSVLDEAVWEVETTDELLEVM